MAGDDWLDCCVDQIKSPLPNALATGPFGSAISSRHFLGRGIPVIRGSNLSQDTGVRLDERGLVFVSEEKARSFSRSIAKRGDLVFTCWGTVDQVGLIDQRSRYLAYVISNKQMKLTPDANRADSLFLYYNFASARMREQIVRQAIGSSVPGFNLGQLKLIQLRLPPLPEQRAIAHILGTLDDKIELNRRMSETLEAMAKGLFQSWFVDFDPVRAKIDGKNTGLPARVIELFPDAFQESDLGEIPAGWSVGALDEAVEINPSRPLKAGAEAPYLDMANMPTRGHVPDAVATRAAGSGARFMNGDTLLARITPCLENGKTAFVDFLRHGQVGWGSTEYIVLHAKAPFALEFAYCLARSARFRDFAIRSMTGSSGRQRVPADALRHFLLPLAPAAVAIAFGRAVRPLFLRASALARQSRTLAALRDALLPKLISGELRVKDAERFVEASA